MTTVRVIRIDVCMPCSSYLCEHFLSRYYPYIFKRLNVFRIVMVLLTKDWFRRAHWSTWPPCFYCLAPRFLLPWQRDVRTSLLYLSLTWLSSNRQGNDQYRFSDISTFRSNAATSFVKIFYFLPTALILVSIKLFGRRKYDWAICVGNECVGSWTPRDICYT